MPCVRTCWIRWAPSCTEKRKPATKLIHQYCVKISSIKEPERNNCCTYGTEILSLIVLVLVLFLHVNWLGVRCEELVFRHLRQNVEEQCGIENATKRARGLGFRARAGAQRLPKGPLACDLIMPDSSSIPFMIPPFVLLQLMDHTKNPMKHCYTNISTRILQ